MTLQLINITRSFLKKRVVVICLFLGVSCFIQAQSYTLSGKITSSQDGETLPGVYVIITNKSNTGVISNQYGFYSITLPAGEYEILVDYLGFKTIKKTISFYEDAVLDFSIEEGTETLDEIVLSEEASEKKKKITDPVMSVNKITSKTILSTPTVLGEPDVIKALLMLPGVTTASESSSGFNVRGGASDQNLVLMDEAIIFNSAHLFGFFSVFNPDSVKDITLYKGGIPAKYGGRVSSILDIYQREGNTKEFKAKGAVGTVFSRLMLEAPIVKDKSSFIVAGRRSYADIFLPLFRDDLQDTSLYFYDLNTKFNYRFNRNNRLYLSGYFGRDVYDVASIFKNVYGNSYGNLRWNHLFSDKLFSNMSVVYSDYFYGFQLNVVGFDWESSIQNINFKYDFKHFLTNKIQLSYGINNVYYDFNPGKILPISSDSEIEARTLTKKFANEFGAYFGVDQKITNNLNVYYGLRVSNFLRLGQSLYREYQNDQPVIYDSDLKVYSSAEVVKEQSLDRSEVLKDFTNLEPRATISLKLNDDNSLKASYNRMAQYLHLISNADSQTPLDVWVPSGPYIKPQILDQYALGFFRNFNMFSLDIEVYYKDLQNRIDYINDANLIANDQIETVILNGIGRAYGLEIYLQKTKGKVRGTVAYTLARSEQKTTGIGLNEIGISYGNWYPTPWNKTHDLSVTAEYVLNKKWRFNANFIYQTGRPTNFPQGKYYFETNLVANYSDERNANQLPDYHRMDIAATLTPLKNEGRKFKTEWIFSIYNLYNRYNANSITFRPEEGNPARNQAVQTTIFGIVPSVSYNFNF